MPDPQSRPGLQCAIATQTSEPGRSNGRRRAPEDVAKWKSVCSTCSPANGGNNTGYGATSGPDWWASSGPQCVNGLRPDTRLQHQELPHADPIFIIPGAASAT